MQPQQPNQPSYDFIANGPQAPKRAKFGSGSTQKDRIIFIGGIGVVAIIVISILVSILTSGSGGTRDALLNVQQIQAETVRVSDIALLDISSQPVKNVAINASLTAASDQQSLAAVAGPLGVSFNDKDLALGENPETDTRLETAKAAGLLDETVLEVLREQLESYRDALIGTFEVTSNPNLQNELSIEYEAVKLLLTQLDQTRV